MNGRFEVSAVSTPGGEAPNEDHYLASDGWAVVLDGVTRYPDDGCVHDVPWYAKRLGAAIGARIEGGLRTALGEAIAAVAERHDESCDLSSPVSPAATVAAVRFAEDRLEWLVLGDSSVAWRDAEGDVEARTDERLSRLTGTPPVEEVGGIRRFPVRYIAEVRNRPGGFWVAAADPGAADEALTGSVEIEGVRDVMLCTDGLTRLIDRYGFGWRDLFETASSEGVAELVSTVREHERREPRSRGGKRHDDATAVLVRVNR